MQTKKVAVIMGSDSDMPVVESAIRQLKDFGIETEVFVMSAHRTPNLAAEFARSAKKNGFAVLIAAASLAAHLAGVLAAQTILPVIGIPVHSKLAGGLDSLLSTVQMPPGVPVATVGVDCAKNAAVLAAQILAVSNSDLALKLEQFKVSMEKSVVEKNNAIKLKIN